MIFVKRTIASSIVQLSTDFEEYPLQGFSAPEKRDVDFYIVSTSYLNKKIYDYILLFRMWRGDVSPGVLSNHVGQGRSEMSAIYRTQMESYAALFNDMKKHGWLAKCIFLIIAIPLGVYLFIRVFWLVITSLFNMALTQTTSSRGFGFSSAVTFMGKPEIVVQTKVYRSSEHQSVVEAIITHEHIHLLQKRYFSELEMPFRNATYLAELKLDNVRSILKDPDKNIQSSLYYLSADEMEARLHEVVLSFYRSFRVLPRDQAGLVDMLLGSERLGKIVTHMLEKSGETIGRSSVRPFSCRNEQPELDIFLTIAVLRDEYVARDYILEVLPVMYANLLFLYGFVEESDFFRNTIASSSLHDYLYADEA